MICFFKVDVCCFGVMIPSRAKHFCVKPSVGLVGLVGLVVLVGLDILMFSSLALLRAFSRSSLKSKMLSGSFSWMYLHSSSCLFNAMFNEKDLLQRRHSYGRLFLNRVFFSSFTS